MTSEEGKMANRYRYVARDVQEPAYGVVGEAWPASGYSDPNSCEYGAYLFQPDGCENAYYCDPERDLAEVSR
jgi:hypothetical protein